MELSYYKLRKILSFVLKNEVLRKTLEDMLSGKEVKITEMGLLDLLESANLDIQIIEILTEKKADKLTAEEGLEVLAGFFTNIAGSYQSFQKLLSSFGFQLQTKTNTV